MFQQWDLKKSGRKKCSPRVAAKLLEQKHCLLPLGSPDAWHPSWFFVCFFVCFPPISFTLRRWNTTSPCKTEVMNWGILSSLFLLLMSLNRAGLEIAVKMETAVWHLPATTKSWVPESLLQHRWGPISCWFVRLSYRTRDRFSEGGHVLHVLILGMGFPGLELCLNVWWFECTSAWTRCDSHPCTKTTQVQFWMSKDEVVGRVLLLADG